MWYSQILAGEMTTESVTIRPTSNNNSLDPHTNNNNSLDPHHNPKYLIPVIIPSVNISYKLNHKLPPFKPDVFVSPNTHTQQPKITRRCETCLACLVIVIGSDTKCNDQTDQAH